MTENERQSPINVVINDEVQGTVVSYLRCGRLSISKPVDARGLHGLSCRRSAPRQQRHSHLNDILWRAIKRAQMPTVKEPINLMRDDNKRPDGTTLLPWARGKPMAWDVTVPDTYAESHIGSTATKPGAAAQKTAQNKIDILQIGQHTHLLPICHRKSWYIWHQMATELTQGIGRRITTITEDNRETTFLFQRLSMALHRGNAVSFHNTMVTE